ncbi:MAG: hypothetical protein R3245_08665, partial [Kiloniellales bacterium]|nr:hypothetical protein [Kiloniellales bacterium]
PFSLSGIHPRHNDLPELAASLYGPESSGPFFFVLYSNANLEERSGGDSTAWMYLYDSRVKGPFSGGTNTNIMEDAWRQRLLNTDGWLTLLV